MCRARLPVVPISAATRGPRRHGATIEKLDVLVAVAPHWRVSQYRSEFGSAEATALIRTLWAALEISKDDRPMKSVASFLFLCFCIPTIAQDFAAISPPKPDLILKGPSSKEQPTTALGNMKTDSNGKVTGSFVVYGGPSLTQVSSLSFSADGKLLAVGGTPNFVEVWDVENQKEILTFAGGSTVALAPDGKVLVSDGKDIRLWAVPSGELLRTIKWTGEMISQFSFSSDGTNLLISSNGNDDAVFAIPAGERIATLKNTQHGQFSKDGSLIVGGNAKHILIWRTKDWSQVRDLPNGPDYVTRFAIDPKEDLAVVGGPNNARLVRLGSGEEVGKVGQGYTNFAAFSREGLLVLTYPSSGFSVWDRAGKELCRISELGNGTMAISGDDRWLAAPPVGSGDVRIWKMQALLTSCNMPRVVVQ